MPATSLGELFVEELRDMYDGEKRLVRALPKMAKAAESRDLKTAFTSHLKETEKQVKRLEQVSGVRIARIPTHRAVLAGMLGGLAGTLAMNYAQRLWTRVVDGAPPQSAGGKHDARLAGT